MPSALGGAGLLRPSEGESCCGALPGGRGSAGQEQQVAVPDAQLMLYACLSSFIAARFPGAPPGSGGAAGNWADGHAAGVDVAGRLRRPRADPGAGGGGCWRGRLRRPQPGRVAAPLPWQLRCSPAQSPLRRRPWGDVEMGEPPAAPEGGGGINSEVLAAAAAAGIDAAFLEALPPELRSEVLSASGIRASLEAAALAAPAPAEPTTAAGAKASAAVAAAPAPGGSGGGSCWPPP